MKDLRVEIQNKLIEVLAKGTYYPVTYAASTVSGVEAIVPSIGTTSVKPAQILCNEVNMGLSKEAKFCARENGYAIRNWRFQANMDFAQEVSLSFFFTKEMKQVTFQIVDYFVSVNLADCTVEHPVQQGGHTGTRAAVGFTVNTRR